MEKLQYMVSGFADEIHPDFDVQLNVLKELGQKFIEFRSADGIGVGDMSVKQVRDYQDKLREAGIRVSAIGSLIGKIFITEDFQPHFESFQHVVNLAKEMGTPYIRMFSFYIPEGEPEEKYKEEVFYRIGKLVDYAAKQNVVLLHENEQDIYGENADCCRELMEEFYGPHFKCTFDFANFVQCGQDTIEAYQMLKPYVNYVHVKDAIKGSGEVVVAGDGDGHLKEIMKELLDGGYEGYFSIEPHLVDFELFASLQQTKEKKEEQDGIAAYKKAFRAFHNLMEEYTSAIL